MFDATEYVRISRIVRGHFKRLSIVLLLSAVPFPVPALTGGPGLVARYNFDEVAAPTRNDSAGYNTAATENSATAGFVYDDAPLPAGTYGSLKILGDGWGPTGGLDTGTGYWVTAANNELGGLTNDFTVMAWIKPDAVDSRQRIIGASAPASSTGWSFGIDGDNVDPGKLILTGYGIADVFTPANAVTAGVWQHVAVTKSSTAGVGVKFYVNGVVDAGVDNSTYTAPWNASTDTYELLDNAGAGERFAGRVDEIRVYRGVLTPEQIQAAAVPPPRLVANYTFDEAAGALRLDSAGFNSNAVEDGSGFSYLRAQIPAGTYGSVTIAGTTFGASGGISGMTGDWLTGSNDELGALVNDFTVMAWVNPDSITSRERIINATSGGGWGFGITPVGNLPSEAGLILTGYGAADVVSTGVGVTTGWQHLAVTKSSQDSVTFYRNGQLFENVSGSTGDWASSAGPYALMGSGDERLSGSVDEVRVYQGVLSQQQIGDAASGLLCSAPNLALLDYQQYGGSVSDDLAVADDDLISDLNVTLDISHTFVSDLQVVLEHVDTGTTRTLLELSAPCGYPNVLATLDDSANSSVDTQCAQSGTAILGTFRPTQPLSAFADERLGGTWRLYVNDKVQGDSGTLNRWCLQAQKSTFPDEIDANGFEP